MGTLTPDHRAWLTGMVEHCAARAAALEDDPHPSAAMRATVLRSIAQGHRAKILGLTPAPLPPQAAPPSPSSPPGEQLPLFEMTA